MATCPCPLTLVRRPWIRRGGPHGFGFALIAARVVKPLYEILRVPGVYHLHLFFSCSVRPPFYLRNIHWQVQGLRNPCKGD